MLTKNADVRIPLILEMIFPQKWLDSQNPEDPDKRTNREIETAVRESEWSLNICQLATTGSQTAY
jgi:hypothetical protein